MERFKRMDMEVSELKVEHAALLAQGLQGTEAWMRMEEKYYRLRAEANELANESREDGITW
jgi:hypothetical protein